MFHQGVCRLRVGGLSLRQCSGNLAAHLRRLNARVGAALLCWARTARKKAMPLVTADPVGRGSIWGWSHHLRRATAAAG